MHKILQKNVISVLLIIVCGFWVSAKEAKPTTILRLRIKDDLTHLSIPANAHLYKIDPNLPEGEEFVGNGLAPKGLVDFTVEKGRTYDGAIFEMTEERHDDGTSTYNPYTMVNYEPYGYKITIPEDAKDVVESTVYLKRRQKKAHELNEVTVTASRVLFYNDGDTLVYNADAFVLAEGTMLDGLLAKMPGVELNSNGVIRVNGRRVESLLINGKDLFNGQNALALSNLAAYTVKNVAIYEKDGKVSKLMGQRMPEDVQYVMDVRLKREYSMGWIVNADGGYGTSDKYMGRLFASWFSDFVSVSAYGSANNLADRSVTGNTKQWAELQSLRQSENTVQKGGITYFSTGYDEKWELKGDVEVEHYCRHHNSTTSTEMYFTGPTIFNYNESRSRNRNLSVKTKHYFYAPTGRKAILEIWPKFTYNCVRDRLDNHVASFSKPNKDQFADMTGTGSNLTKEDSLINSQLIQTSFKEQGLEADILARSTIKFVDRKLPTLLQVSLSGNYKRKSTDDFDRQSYLTFNNDKAVTTSTHRYRNGGPAIAKSIGAEAYFFHFFADDRMKLTADYKFNADHNCDATRSYLLDRLSDAIDSDFKRPLDYLPSVAERDRMFDPDNSDRSRLLKLEHIAKVGFNSKLFNIGNVTLNAGLNVSAHYLDRKFDYDFVKDHNFHKKRLYFDEELEMRVYTKHWIHNLSFSHKPQNAEMHYFVDSPSSNDLIRNLGNERLKNPDAWNFNMMTYTFGLKAAQTINANFQLVRNAVGLSRFYNVGNGMLTYKPFNVNGNMSGNAAYKITVPINRRRTLNIESNTSLGYVRSVDCSISYADEQSIDLYTRPAKNVVNNYSCSESLSISWQKGIFTTKAYTNLSFSRYTGDNTHAFSAWTCDYGAIAGVNLPKNWSLSTDLTLYTRRGFTDSRLNTTDVIWNARISKSILKGSLVFVVDGYDMLQQLSNVTYMVNAQARTETVSNVIPSYVLFHIQYRFNRQPKKH